MTDLLAARQPTRPAVETRPTSESTPAHWPLLGGLRGLAVLAVMLYHFAGALAPARVSVADRLLLAVLETGWAGVDVFFVLSGFLITGILLRAKSRPGYWRTFLIRRALRIFPLYYVALFALFVVVPRLTADPRAHVGLAAQGWWWAYAANVYIAIHGWPSALSTATHFWSLAIEEQFYLIWPWVVLALPVRRLRRLCVAMVLLSPVVRGLLFVLHAGAAPGYVLMLTHADGLALGAFLSTLSTAGEQWTRARAMLRRAAIPALLVLVALVAAGQMLKDSAFAQVFGITAVLGLSALALVDGVSERGAVAPVLRSAPLQVLGKYSYALYVVHYPIVLMLPWFAATRALVVRPVWGTAIPGILVGAAALTAASMAVALATWSAIEMPFLRLKDRLAPGTRAPRPPGGEIVERH